MHSTYSVVLVCEVVLCPKNQRSSKPCWTRGLELHFEDHADRLTAPQLEFVSLATGGLHQPAVPINFAGNWRAGSGDDRPGKRPFVTGEESQGAEAHRNLPGGSTIGSATVRLGAGGN